ncbi:TadE/TadG family type IV pilus assembly protein [Bosea sp. 2KB_26]|uniref:TadE/TadG family type IV pilus assembly protein n=1 Tax=Bosea sp. 2KB_26 TaxID=3237475 RepID=UPI003F91D1E4
MRTTMRQFFSIRRNKAALRRLRRHLQTDRKGVAAVEFALILPVMLLLYYGIAEIGEAAMADRRVTQLNRALVDLAAQGNLPPESAAAPGSAPRGTALSDADVDTIFLVGQMIMAPFTTTPRMMFASVTVDDKGVAKVCWSAQRNTTAPPTNIKLPDGLLLPKTSVIMAEASYAYEPLLGKLVFKDALTLGGDRIYMRPRMAAKAGALNIEQVARIQGTGSTAKTIVC